MTKKLAIFCDGTGNELKARGNTNVLRLHGLALENQGQVRFYSAGVGTQGAPQALTAIGRGVTKVLGLAFGYGLKANVVECYTFIMRRWQPGDSIYIFGFSRGAYTARALAGMLRVVGLLRPDQENMVPYALKLFWKSHGKNIDWEHVNGFTAQFSRPDFEKWGYPVLFLGAWDTVKAVGWFTRRLQLPYTRLLKSVRTVRLPARSTNGGRNTRRTRFQKRSYRNRPVTCGKSGSQGFILTSVAATNPTASWGTSLWRGSAPRRSLPDLRSMRERSLHTGASPQLRIWEGARPRSHLGTHWGKQAPSHTARCSHP